MQAPTFQAGHSAGASDGGKHWSNMIRRVKELDGSFGFLTQQIKSVHKDLLAFQAKTEERFGKVNGKIDKVENELRGLRTDMPKIVSSAMREVLGGRKRKS